MKFKIEDIRIQIDKALRSLASRRGTEFVVAIRSILYANLERNRIQGFIEEGLEHVHEYVKRVVDHYNTLNPYINEIQIERTERVWKPLLEKMQVWSYNYLIRKGFYGDGSTQDIANECANEAALEVISSHFPYDVDFEPWLHVVVLNVCRRYIRGLNQKKNQIQDNSVELANILEEIPAPVDDEPEQQVGQRQDLEEAIALLPEARRRAIELLYFEELSPKEVAKKMGKSVGAIYSLQFNAFEDLRKVLDKIRNDVK